MYISIYTFSNHDYTMKKLTVAIIDVLGLTYDGNTLEHRGLGGSESAAILMAKELSALGMHVTVYNSCRDSQAKDGIYDGVQYLDLSVLSNGDIHFIEPCDIFIGSRSVRPFTEPQFKRLKGPKTQKILWMHDTFCDGDHMVEPLVMNGTIDEIFTLSDFHTTYVSTAHHGGERRNPEVLKRKMWVTRNGIKKRLDWVDPMKKDPNLFIYNSSVSKGMFPLIQNVWPAFKKAVPAAKLVIIGGFYRFRDNAPPDEQEKAWRVHASDPALKALDITFTGIIPQQEIAEILAGASFLLCPGAFPETFGISALESLAYKTPIIAARFGALEETAVEQACYLMDYSIEPNSLYPNINKEEQVKLYLKLMLQAHGTPYLHAQKMQYCEIVNEVNGWDTVALQWKQHFYKKTGRYLDVDQYRRVQHINRRVHQIFGRRQSNTEEWPSASSNPQQPIRVISPFFNGEKYIESCIRSVATQDYENYIFHLIDDCSTDSGFKVATNVIASLPEHIQKKITLTKNHKNLGSVRNYVENLRSCGSGTIAMLLDGDDSLVNRNDIFQFYNELYDGTVDFTYGSCWSMVDNIPLVAQPYPPEVIATKAFREYRFAWNMPYTHLRTMDPYLIHGEPDAKFQDADGKWLRAGGDTAIFYTAIEKATGIVAVKDIVVNYNDINPLNDYKVNAEEQTKNAQGVMNNFKKDMKKLDNLKLVKTPVIPVKRHAGNDGQMLKRILVAVPTAKYIESETFKSIYNLTAPEGYSLQFQYFYGYQIDQIRNLIADWTVRGFDYLFAVDADIVFPSDTLIKLLAHDKDVVSGVYIQRRDDKQVPELYEPFGNGGSRNIPIENLHPSKGLIEVMACGFGCVLVKKAVMKDIGYPQFTYQSALTMENTVSEDFLFCMKAKAKGFTIWADTSIVCEHIGSTKFVPKFNPISSTYTKENLEKFKDNWTTVKISKDDTEEKPEEKRWRELANQRLLPVPAQQYLHNLGKVIKPKVIYDIGACVMHWTTVAKEAWPDAHYVLFEAMQGPEFLYKEAGIKDFEMGVLGKYNGTEVNFYENKEHPGGNSYYRENTAEVDAYFPESSKQMRLTTTLDAVVKNRNFPLPDLIKMDIQGAEFDVLQGATECLAHATDLILELQQVEYNVGAPLKDTVITWLADHGWVLVAANFSHGDVDGDYHFKKVR